jgi:MoaA/NifB/PqqE/SkfB family radical SAM enzyme
MRIARKVFRIAAYLLSQVRNMILVFASPARGVRFFRSGGTVSLYHGIKSNVGYAFFKGELPFQRPSVLIGCTLRCNVRCIFCLAHSALLQEAQEKKENRTWQVEGRGPAAGDLPLGLFKRIIDDLAYLSPRQISLSGNGETLLYPDLLDAIAYVRSRSRLQRTRVGFSTNGILLTSGLAKELMRLGLGNINFSINAGHPDTYERMHAVSAGNFMRVKEQVREFVGLCSRKAESSVEISASFVLCKANYLEIKEMLTLSREMGISQANFRMMYFCEQKRKSLEGYILDDAERKELETVIFESILTAQQMRISSNLSTLLAILKKGPAAFFTPTLKHAYTCQIHANGMVNPYDFYAPMGNTHKDSFLSVWYSPQYLEFRSRIKRLSFRREAIPTRPFCLRCEVAGANNSNRCHIIF